MTTRKFYIELYLSNKSTLRTIEFDTMNEALIFFNVYFSSYELPFTLTVVEKIKHPNKIEFIEHNIEL